MNHSSQNPIRVQVGGRAARLLAERGWHPDLFTTMLGASGGPKWLILAAVDRVVHRYLLAPRTQPIDLIGSSIGTWRHACLTQPDPDAAISRFERAYIGQAYSEKPSAAEVSRVATEILYEAIGADGVQHLVGHHRLRSHVVTARAAGIASGRGRLAIGAGMGLAALGNAIDRRLLDRSFQRVVFSQPDAPLPAWIEGFATRQAPLMSDNVVSALKASGAIPLVLEAERDIPGAPAGNYWDGGIIDYHFALPRSLPDGLLLYPHFTDTLTDGWFDKFLPWRRGQQPACDALVMVSPSQALLDSLPYGKIPDRKDFQRLSTEQRQRYWRACLDASARMAEALEGLITGSDPLAGVDQLPG